MRSRAPARSAPAHRAGAAPGPAGPGAPRRDIIIK